MKRFDFGVGGSVRQELTRRASSVLGVMGRQCLVSTVLFGVCMTTGRCGEARMDDFTQ